MANRVCSPAPSQPAHSLPDQVLFAPSFSSGQDLLDFLTSESGGLLREGSSNLTLLEKDPI